MADDKSNIIGRIARGGFETTGRAESWAEQRTASVNIVGKVEDIFDAAKPGDSMAQHANWFGGKFNPNYFFRTVEVSSDDGVTANARISLLKCPQGKTKPYNVTWQVGMEEVQMKLINHPDIIKNADVSVLIQWENTEPGLRVEEKDGKYTFYYFRYSWSDGNGIQYTRMEVTGEWEKAYCLAVTQGIDTFNRYLPVITKNSYYLELPGANYDSEHVITGGTISDFSRADSIGHFDAPDLKVAGFADGTDGVWFKSHDSYTTNADGTATRTESWVFTNDKRHQWIYTGKLDTKGK